MHAWPLTAARGPERVLAVGGQISDKDHYIYKYTVHTACVYTRMQWW